MLRTGACITCWPGSSAGDRVPVLVDRLCDPRADGPVGGNELLSERIRARVLLLIGEEAELTTEQRGPDDPDRVPVSRLVAETGIPRARLAGADVVAVISDAGELEHFEQVDGTDGGR